MRISDWSSDVCSSDLFVIGLDRYVPETHEICDHFIDFDLARCRDDEYFQSCIAQIRKAADERPIMALVNNAAVQRLAKTSAVTMADWDESITVNLTAPMRLSQALLPELAANDGIILNIGSVHATATKTAFVSYAPSRAPLPGLTRVLARL